MNQTTDKLIAAIENVINQCEPTPVPYQPLLELQQVLHELQGDIDPMLDRLATVADDLINGAYEIYPTMLVPEYVFIDACEYAELANALSDYEKQ